MIWACGALDGRMLLRRFSSPLAARIERALPALSTVIARFDFPSAISCSNFYHDSPLVPSITAPRRAGSARRLRHLGRNEPRPIEFHSCSPSGFPLRRPSARQRGD
jgi:hypothetical protein